MEAHFDLSDLLAGLTDIGSQLETHAEVKTKCPNCQMSYKDFRATGQLGCSECYKTFKRNLFPLLKRIHGSTQYIGKTPVVLMAGGKSQTAKAKAISTAQELQELKTKLQKAIQLEEFEEAARLRDKIKNLEGKNGRRA